MMTDPLMSWLLWWAPVVAAALLLSLVRATRLQPSWLAIATALFALNFLILLFGSSLIPLKTYFPDFHWNWSGKAASVIATLIVFAVLGLSTRSIGFASTGITLRQNAGSLKPALLAAAFLVAAKIAVEIAAADGNNLDPERLWFEATMPGLDEELFYRGLLLAAVGAAIPSASLNLFGARISWAGFLITACFALAHGVIVQNGQVMSDWLAASVTGFFGFGLLWIRERTGSVLAPILAHNAINVLGSVF